MKAVGQNTVNPKSKAPFRSIIEQYEEPALLSSVVLNETPRHSDVIAYKRCRRSVPKVSYVKRQQGAIPNNIVKRVEESRADRQSAVRSAPACSSALTLRVRPRRGS